jgi:putative oxidoreductase
VKSLLATSAGWSNFFLRIFLAVVMFPHGAQKVLGWFGGHGPIMTFNFFVQRQHLPVFLVILVFAAEFLGPIGLFFGFLTRIAAFGIFCDMIGAVYLVHWRNGFFMNWANNPKAGEGFEYHLLMIGMCIALMIGGAGALSLDGAIAGERKEVAKM